VPTTDREGRDQRTGGSYLDRLFPHLKKNRPPKRGAGSCFEPHS
jgi:hypothetical protein